MRQKPQRHQEGAERTIKDIRRQTRRRYSAEDKIRIMLSGLKGEDSIAEETDYDRHSIYHFDLVGRR